MERIDHEPSTGRKPKETPGRLGSDAVEPPPPSQAKEQVKLGHLVSLVKQMNPFLDGHGSLYCHIPGPDGRLPMTWRLESEAALSLITYRSFTELGEVPSPGTLNQVVNLVRGELWHHRPPSASPRQGWAATVSAIKKSADVRGDFVGSASEMLDRLVEDSKGDAEVYDALPKTPDQLGIVLNRVGLLLRREDIELYRPRRTELRRLWAWRTVAPEVAPDTPATPDASGVEVTSKIGSQKEGSSRPDDTSDGWTDRQRNLMAHYRGGRGR